MVVRRAAALAALLACSAAPAPASQERASGAADRTGIGVTIYNANVAVVRDRRRLSIPAGTSDIALRDVANGMLPETVAFRDVGGPGAFDVVEQNFEEALLTPRTLLAANVGRTVETARREPDGSVRRERAALLAANGGVVLQYRDRVETGSGEELRFSSAAAGLRPHATLVATIAAPRAARRNVEITYLTHGLRWNAVYTAMLAPDDDRLDLHGDVSIDNRSGTAYERANVQLVAGDVNVAVNPRSPQAARPVTMIGRVIAAPLYQEDLFSYHLYTVPRPVTIADAQTKRFTLLDAARVPVTKTLELRRGTGVGVYVSFENRGAPLGIPLPAGPIRIYKRDARGVAQYLGAGALEHTPRNAAVRLRLGSAADLTARTLSTNSVNTADSTETTNRITLINGRDVARQVRIVEPLFGNWEIVSSSLPYRKTSAATATWDVLVPPNGTLDLVYRYRVRLHA